MRVSFTASPPVVWIQRVCSPRAHSGSPQVAHLGRSAPGFWLQSSVSPIWTTSWINCARSWLIRSSTAASISAHVADLLLFSPLRHPQHVSQPRAHLLYLRTPFSFVLLRFHALASLLVFPLFYHLPPVCKKMNRTRYLEWDMQERTTMLYCTEIELCALYCVYINQCTSSTSPAERERLAKK